MASHAYCRFILQTPTGYLTPTGTVKDIGDKDVIVLNIYGIGGWGAPRERNIAKFLELSTAEVNPEECKLLQYSCPLDRYYDCSDCLIKKTCKFWTNRKECKFT